MKKTPVWIMTDLRGAVFFRIAGTALLLALAAVHLTGCKTESAKQTAAPAAVTAPAAPLQPADSSGIEVASVRLTANDHMIDFRYRVTDSQKASRLFGKESKPYLVHAKTGKVLSVPRTAKVGPLMSTYEHQQGRTYWMFFGNPGMVKAGDEVSVVIGEFKAENIVVQ